MEVETGLANAAGMVVSRLRQSWSNPVVTGSVTRRGTLDAQIFGVHSSVL